jgi:minor extracellular serine protease Vpr
MQHGPRTPLSRLLLALIVVFFGTVSAQAQGQNEAYRSLQGVRDGSIPSLVNAGPERAHVEPERHYLRSLIDKIDAPLRSLLQHERIAFKRGQDYRVDVFAPYSAHFRDDEVRVDVLIKARVDIGATLEATFGARHVTRAGDIFTAQVALSSIDLIALDAAVDFIELAARRPPLNKHGRVEIQADRVHAGTGLPMPLKGEGVIVGVIDSGIDFSHPDFSDASGSRIQYLLEYTQNGQNEWSKQQIDTEFASVTQRDLDDGMGHGTHVTGTAAGGGRFSADYGGVAPSSDIIFVKGFVDGGFSDVAVVSGSEYIFSRAEALGKPAVINLSLGSNFGPIDGSSLYEQALSNLTGPGRIIVAAAGNEGFELIHAGANLAAAQRNVTLLLPNNPSYAAANLWYRPGVISHVAVGALYYDGSDLHFLGNTDFVPAGSFLNETPLTYEDLTLGYVRIDAQTTSDPRNGDGNVLVEIGGDPANGVDLTEVIWVILYDSNVSGRADMWAFRGDFWPHVVGFAGVNEVPGDTESTIGTPASAHRVISVGSYVTSNSWTDLDGTVHQWRNPDPSRDPESSIVPEIGQKSFFSSFGPTRDGRTAPDISAPGELIFSPLSSHLTEGQGFERGLVLQGGGYVGQQGTSMAAPHVAGVVALMLQVDPTLDYDDVLSILQQTARTDAWTGSAPNNSFGSGKVDAYEAVKLVVATSGPPTQPTVLRRFDPSSPQTLWTIDQSLPVDSGFVFGTNLYFDRAKATAFTLPGNATTADVTAVRVWFGYKRSNLTSEPYSIVFYHGDAAQGPTGSPIASHQFLLRDIMSDDSFGTNKEPTVHSFNTPVPVGSSFFVGVDFGNYPASDIGSAAIMATPLVGSRVPEVWEQWGSGAWHNLSDAWHGQGSPGSGTDGWHMWLEVEFGTTVSSEEPGSELPLAFALLPNYPNPFNPATIIPFTLPRAADVNVAVFDILGRQIARLAEGVHPAGTHEVRFDAGELPSGMYMVRLQSGSQVSTRMMVLVR